MKRNYIKALYLAIITLFAFVLTGCDFHLPVPGYFKTTTKDALPEESYERSTLDNISNFNSAYTYKDVHKLIYGTDGYMPSVGNVKILVIPIKFSDIYTSTSNLEKYHTDLERAFFGDDTGYESLKSYYEKSSYGKLNITGTVLDWYTPNNTSSYYENVYNNRKNNITSSLGSLAVEALNALAYDMDLSEYDYDKDGILDGVYLVCNKMQQKYDSLYWAWVTYYGGNKKVKGYELYQFMWSNVCFMYKDDYYKDVRGSNVNAITFIHETGHMMGSDDYYDYSPNEYSDSIFGRRVTKEGDGCNLGAGSFDMMDGNIGDHCANSKMNFGWITPYVVTRDTTIELNKFSTTGDAIIVAPSFDMDSKNLSEYFVIEYYDYDGLARQNVFDDRGYTKSGIRIYHVNAKLEKDKDYWSLFKYDNSYTEHAYLTLVSAEYNKKGQGDFIDSSENACNRSLFQEGDTFIPTNCSEYVNKLLLNVEITINYVYSDTANITIKFKD